MRGIDEKGTQVRPGRMARHEARPGERGRGNQQQPCGADDAAHQDEPQDRFQHRQRGIRPGQRLHVLAHRELQTQRPRSGKVHHLTAAETQRRQPAHR